MGVRHPHVDFFRIGLEDVNLPWTVGMCQIVGDLFDLQRRREAQLDQPLSEGLGLRPVWEACLLYTSDSADERG